MTDAATFGPVDIEAIVVAAWKTDEAVVEAVGVAERIATELPPAWAEETPEVNGIDLPRLQVWRVGGNPTDSRYRLERAAVQVASWADRGPGGKAKAYELIAVGVRSLYALEGQVISAELGVVTGVEVDLAPVWQPDPVTDLPRYIARLGIFAHR